MFSCSLASVCIRSLLVVWVFGWSIVNATELRWAASSDALSLDPHAQNELMSNSLNAHIYERLTSRDSKLALIPGLAQTWEQIDPLTWRFHLRPGVRFHDGALLTAEDVVFSVQRAQHPASAIAQYARRIGKVAVVAPMTVEFRLDRPNPVMLDHVDAIPIMNLAWAKARGVLAPLSHKQNEDSVAKREANGTGPFSLVSRELDSRTVLQRFVGYWGRVPGNVDRLVVLTISNSLTRTAALVSGQVDLVNQVAPQDLDRLTQTPGLVVRKGLENRVIFLGMDQHRDELLNSNIKGRNPLKDPRVRLAMALALDTDQIQKIVMRDMTRTTSCMLPSAWTCEQLPKLEANRPKHDLERARTLLRLAGYPDGFEVTLDCPNDRYVGDEALCVAMASQWAKAGVRVRVQTMPKAQFFPRLDRLESSFYLLGWGGAEQDAQPTLDQLMHSYDESTGLGEVNYGRFADTELDSLIARAGIEHRSAIRSRLIEKALLRHQAQTYHLVLYRQTLAWAMRDTIQALPAANNHVRAWLIRLNEH